MKRWHCRVQIEINFVEEENQDKDVINEELESYLVNRFLEILVCLERLFKFQNFVFDSHSIQILIWLELQLSHVTKTI
jgi:hypothetical protein